MLPHEAFINHSIQLSTGENARDIVSAWRNDYRNTVFDSYSQTKNASGLISLASDRLLPFLPNATYQAALKKELDHLQANTQKHLTGNVLFLATLRGVELPRDEAFKAICLGDIIMHGESMIYRALHSAEDIESTQGNRFSEMLETLGIRRESVQAFGELNGVALEADSAEAATRGGASVEIVSQVGYFPSSDNLKRCIFIERMQSGSASIFRSQKVMLIGTGAHVGIEGEEYDLAERIRVLLHEGAHATQPDISQAAMEYSALEREISGITSIRTLQPTDISPYYWRDLMDWLGKLREHAQTSRADLLNKLANPNPRIKINADHNIAAMEKENDLAASRLEAHRKIPRNIENGPL